MLFKLFSTSALVFGLALQAQAHTIISPALGVTGTPARSDVQRPSTASPCGNENIAQEIGGSTAVTAAADGTFTVTAQNFNAGQDGSRQVTAQVDATGTGKSFVAAKVTKNGDLAPTDVGTQQITAQLPANTKCAASGCLVAFKTAGGFGNCVVVKQGGAAATGANTNANATAATGTAAAGTASGAVATATDSNVNGSGNGATTANADQQPKHHHHDGQQQQQKRDVDVRAIGTRAARSFRELEESINIIMPQALPKVALPEGVESKHIPVRDLNIHYLSAGDPKSPLVVLLHGFPELCYSWRKVLVPLAQLGYFVVATDSRGYGRTTSLEEPEHTVKYEDDIAPYSMLNLAHDVVALVFALGHKTCAAVVGHDTTSVVMMSAPFTGPPALPFNVLENPPTPESNIPFWGLHAFLRAYFHMKSGDWAENDPHPISIAEAGGLPHYYIMPQDLTMADVVKDHLPSEDDVMKNTWLPESDLAIFTAEYQRTGFQGGLNRYRTARSLRWVGEIGLFAGKKIEVPAMFLSGKKDWGVYQIPGAAQKMKEEAWTKMVDEDFVLVEGAGHWVQQERPEEVVKQIGRFLKKAGSH
ncbi:hypothetical protein EIP91_005354 [Steccherinum ochraceum]|uniref:AB hydrolase-1 domain-containing protein n=1 Tax=Steccherinum ochraceum TaxID=92696 RepID=A0A4R0RDC5_9APHY|nr:hypothetical protein EIP91_005354 [Steccherinum ochraceum]